MHSPGFRERRDGTSRMIGLSNWWRLIAALDSCSLQLGWRDSASGMIGLSDRRRLTVALDSRSSQLGWRTGDESQDWGRGKVSDTGGLSTANSSGRGDWRQ